MQIGVHITFVLTAGRTYTAGIIRLLILALDILRIGNSQGQSSTFRRGPKNNCAWLTLFSLTVVTAVALYASCPMMCLNCIWCKIVKF